MAESIMEVVRRINDLESEKASNTRIDRIESDRVARMAELERTVNERLSQDAKAAVKRIETLERGEKELYARCQEVAGAALEALRDRDRQDRWHDTYNAALQANAVSGVEARHINAVHESCEAAADRAHGPLEGTQEPFSEMDLAAHLRHVEALVKAARRVIDAEDRHESRYLADILDPLEDALKPFEASRGGE